MEILRISRQWPSEERYALTGQIRRHLVRYVQIFVKHGRNVAYEVHFISKLTDADGENSETDTWLDFAKDCGYLSPEDHTRLTVECRSIGAMLGSMLNNPHPFLLKKTH